MGQSVQVQTLERFEGAYRSCAKTGLTTGLSAGSGSAGHVWAVRWAPNLVLTAGPIEKRKFLVLQRLRARWFTVAGFTAAQEVGLDLFKVTGYTAAHTGGAAITPSPKRTTNAPPFPATLMTGRVATTADLTNGTETFETDPIASAAYAELAAAATVPKGAFELFLSTEDLDRYPIVLGPGTAASPGEGLVLRNTIAQGAGGTARIVVEMDWLEVERY